MVRGVCVLGPALAVGLAAAGITGCGSSASTGGSGAAAAPHTTTLSSGQLIVEAADQTDRAPGYRIAATINIDAERTSVKGAMAGTIERRGDRGALTLTESVGGKTLHLQFRTSGETFYMSGVPGSSTLSHGKRWLSFDLAGVEPGGLQTETASDPARYLAYLRGVGGQIQRVGTASIRGVTTTRYHATIDLDRYAARVPTAERAQVRRSIATLEADLGGHTLPVDVWIDAHREVRQMQLHLPLCVAGHRFSMSMTMDLYDYGQVPAVSIPPASETDNVTPQLKSTLAQSQTSSQSADACSAAG